MHVLFSRLFLDFFQSETDASTSDQLIRTVNVGLPRDSDKHTDVPEDTWRRLFKTACQRLSIDGETVEAAFARYFFRYIRDNHQRICNRYVDSKELLRDLPSIHREFADKGLNKRNASLPPKLRVLDDESSNNGIVIHYESSNQHCLFLETLTKEIVRFYGDEATVVHGSNCSKKGDPACDIIVTWTSTTDS